MTPTDRLALERAVRISADLEVQLDRNARPGTAPFFAILAIAREQATAAMEALVYADPEDIKTVRSLQFEVRRYDELVTWARKLVEEGRLADRILTEEEREDYRAMVLTDNERAEAEALGVQNEDIDG